jgi:DNA-binding PadR family transcriptional regulator
MDIRMLCLGLLSLESATGYDLKKKFELELSHLFSAGYGSIYPALADLAAEGLAVCREVKQRGRPGRKVYSITNEGRAAFRRSLQGIEPRHRVRSEFLTLALFSELIDEQQVDRVLDRQTSEFRNQAEQLGRARNARDKTASAGEKFVAGFGEAVALAAAIYIEENRHLLMPDRLTQADVSVALDSEKTGYKGSAETDTQALQALQSPRLY